MARLIDADAFLKELNERPVDYIDPGCDFYYFEETIESVLNATPTADAVEVVRCKDCRKWFRHTLVDRERGDCRRYQTTKHETGFCDRGERKTE